MATLTLQPTDALLIVDVQSDFCPSGALAVEEADAIIPLLNRWVAHARRVGAVIVASQDWHPPSYAPEPPAPDRPLSIVEPARLRTFATWATFRH